MTLVAGLSLLRSLYLRIPDFFWVPHIGAGSEFLQHHVMTPVLLKSRDQAVGILHVSENNRSRGAGLLACRLDVAFKHLALLLQSDILGELNSLHAETALLHHAPRAH